MPARFPLLKPAVLAFSIATAILPIGAHAEENWPQFRGPEARGVADGAGLPARWSATRNVAWKTNIPGRGWSSPVAWGDRLFLTTVINLGLSEEPKKGLYFGGNRPDVPDSRHQWKVLSLDLETGRMIWEQQIHEGKPESPIHLKNSFASETPVTDGERIYCYFGNLGLYCFDFEGKLLWAKEIPPRGMRYGWGTAASPVLHEDRLYVVNDNEEDSHLLALDKRTGEEVWRVARDEGSNWSTPYVWQNSQRTEIVTLGTDKVRAYGLDGRLLWSLEGMSTITIASPYADGDLLYISSGYVGDRKHRPIYAVRPGAHGDISLAEGEISNQWIAWCQPMAAPYNPSTLVYQDRMYVLLDRGYLSCLNAATGEVVYEAAQLPRGSGFTASPWAYDGKVFCLNEDGVTFVVAAGDNFDLLHTNPLMQDDMAMATPAMPGDRLLIRTSERVYCIREAAAPRLE